MARAQVDDSRRRRIHTPSVIGNKAQSPRLSSLFLQGIDKRAMVEVGDNALLSPAGLDYTECLSSVDYTFALVVWARSAQSEQSHIIVGVYLCMRVCWYKRGRLLLGKRPERGILEYESFGHVWIPRCLISADMPRLGLSICGRMRYSAAVRLFEEYILGAATQSGAASRRD
jgi:hypothetical protein